MNKIISRLLFCILILAGTGQVCLAGKADELASELSRYCDGGQGTDCRVNQCEIILKRNNVTYGEGQTITAPLGKMRPMYSVKGEHDADLRLTAVAGSPVRILAGEKVSYTDFVLVPVPDEYHRGRAGQVLVELIEACGGRFESRGKTGGGISPQIKIKGDIRSNIMIYSRKP